MLSPFVKIITDKYPGLPSLRMFLVKLEPSPEKVGDGPGVNRYSMTNCSHVDILILILLTGVLF